MGPKEMQNNISWDFHETEASLFLFPFSIKVKGLKPMYSLWCQKKKKEKKGKLGIASGLPQEN